MDHGLVFFNVVQTSKRDGARWGARGGGLGLRVLEGRVTVVVAVGDVDGLAVGELGGDLALLRLQNLHGGVALEGGRVRDERTKEWELERTRGFALGLGDGLAALEDVPTRRFAAGALACSLLSAGGSIEVGHRSKTHVGGLEGRGHGHDEDELGQRLV